MTEASELVRPALFLHRDVIVGDAFLRPKIALFHIKESNGVLRNGCSVNYAWIAEQSKIFPLTEMCDVLKISVSGYRAWSGNCEPEVSPPARKGLND